MENSNKNTNQTVVKIVAAALALLFVMLLIALIVNLVRLGAVRDRKAALDAQNARLEQLIEKNDNMIEYCNSTEFIDEYAREYLDMVKRGEVVIGGEED